LRNVADPVEIAVYIFENSAGVLTLDDNDRLLGVLSFVEHYPRTDCAQLLGTPTEKFARRIDLQGRSDQPEHSLSSSAATSTPSVEIMFEPVEGLLQIYSHQSTAPAGDVLLRPGFRLMRRTSEPETVTLFGTIRIPPALRYHVRLLLHHSVQHRRDAPL
jgi:hypothetical protein